MRKRSPRAGGGMAVVAVIVLIAVLFLTGTVMALAVSSSLHTVDIVTAHDAVHYAAESAVARGVGAIEVTGSCPADPAVGINGQDLRIRCHSQQIGGDLDDEDGAWASIPHGQLNPGACAPPIPLPANRRAWAVIGWRGLGSVRVWTTAPGEGCQSSTASPCDPTPMFATVVYFSCSAQTTDRSLYVVAGATGPVSLGTSVIRWAPPGGRVVWTVVGAAGFEVDEADVLLPAQQVLWNTVLS